MKGIVFNLLEEVVSKHHSPDVWDAMLDEARSSGVYTSLGNYPDTDLYALVAAAADRFGLTRNEALRWFGRQAMPILSSRYPALFARHGASRSFVLSVNSFIHPEVRKLYPGASCPMFEFSDDKDGVLMTYASSRKMCYLAHGFIEGAADVFREMVTVTHRRCMHHGDPSCVVDIRWAP